MQTNDKRIIDLKKLAEPALRLEKDPEKWTQADVSILLDTDGASPMRAKEEYERTGVREYHVKKEWQSHGVPMPKTYGGCRRTLRNVLCGPIREENSQESFLAWLGVD